MRARRLGRLRKRERAAAVLAIHSFPNTRKPPLPFCKSGLFIATFAALLVFLPGCQATRGAVSAGPDRWWPTYGGTFANTRHIDLAQIGPHNVADLKLAWKFNTGVHGQFETSPVVVDGTMYVTTGSDNGVFALNAASGAVKWHFVPKIGRARYVFAVNRGVAVDSGRVFYTTLDARLIALDAHTGKSVWDTRVGNPQDGLSEDAAPLAWGGLVFVGSSGNEFGVRGSFSAYSQKDGKLVWRWWTVSPGWEGPFAETAHGFALHRNIGREKAAVAKYRDAWKTGGGAVWMTPALSPKESTVYLSTGNPAPDFNAERRPGDNLYTDSIVALDARSGKMKWYYQETPHDVWDYDAASPPVLIDALDAAGQRVPAVAEAGKTGWLYVLDRRTGKPLRISQAFIPQPHIYAPLTAADSKIQPGDGGGTIGPIAYDPAAHAAFVVGNVEPEVGHIAPVTTRRPESDEQWKAGDMADIGTEASSLLSSIDVDTGRIRWSSPIPNVIYTGPMSANGLVFLGQPRTGDFKAYDASSGKVLWNVKPSEVALVGSGVREQARQIVSKVKGNAMQFWHRVRHQPDYGYEGINAPPVAFRMGGREYIVIASDLYDGGAAPSGNTIFAFALP